SNQFAARDGDDASTQSASASMMAANCPARAQNLATKVRPRFTSVLACNLAWETVRDMKAPPPLAQLTVPRGTDLVKSRTLAAPLLPGRCGTKNIARIGFSRFCRGCTNEQIVYVTGARSGVKDRA